MNGSRRWRRHRAGCSGGRSPLRSKRHGCPTVLARVGETLGGDGKSHARVRLECDRAPLELAFGTDEQGKVRQASFLSATGVACVP